MTAINSQITDREAKRAKALTDLNNLRITIPALEASLARVKCRGIGQKKRDCEANQVNTASLLKQRNSQIKALEEQVVVLNREITDLSSQRQSEGAAIVSLAQQGTTPAAVLANTTAQAEAATTIAEAQAKSIETVASNKAMIYWIVGIILAIVILLFIRKKLTNG